MDLVDGLSAIRHGQKGAYYKRAGIPADTAERMPTLARASMTADAVLAEGGIRAAVERLKRAKMGRIDSPKAKERRAARKHLRDCVVG